MNWKKTATSFLGGFCAVMVAIVLSVVYLSSSASGVSYQNTFTNLLIRGGIYLQKSTTIQPTVTDSADIGTPDKYMANGYIRRVHSRAAIADSFKLGSVVGGPNGAVHLLVHNISGSAISRGDFCVWDNGSIAVTSSVTAGLTPSQIGTMSDSLTDETANGGWLSLVATATGTVDGDTVIVWGKDADGAAQVDTTVLTDGATTTTMVKSGSTLLYWTEIDSLSTEKVDGASAVTFTAYGYATVKASDGAYNDFAGVCAQDSISDNNVGYIATYGPVIGTVDAGSNAASPGVLLELASGGDAVVDTDSTTARNVGVALEYSNADNQKIKVFLDKH